jgi:hypothetical protein
MHSLKPMALESDVKICYACAAVFVYVATLMYQVNKAGGTALPNKPWLQSKTHRTPQSFELTLALYCEYILHLKPTTIAGRILATGISSLTNAISDALACIAQVPLL